MSLFVDTGVWYAHHDTDASRHDIAVAALDHVLRTGEYGRAMTSDYVYDEAVTLTHRRTGSIQAAVALGRRLRGDGYPDAIELLHSSRARFADAVRAYESYADHGLSFTDAMTVALVGHHDVDAVLSFDDDFDGVVERRGPESVVES